MKSFAALMLLVFCCAAAPTTATSLPSPNAATLYREAFPIVDSLDDADQGRIGMCGKDGCWVVTTPLDEKTDALLKGQQTAVNLIRRAATEPTAKWELNGDSKKVVEMANHLPRLSALMVLQAREELREQKPKQAVDDLLVAMTVSRHANSEPILMTRLVETSAWRPGSEALAEHLQELPKDLVASMGARIDQLSKSKTFAEVIRGEYEFAKATSAKQGLMAAGLAGGLSKFYDALADGASLAPAGFDKLVDEQMKKFSANPFAGIVGPAFKGSRTASAILEAKSAMLQTAIDIVLNGDTAVSASKDPFADGKPFAFRKTSKGFELQSALIAHDKPVVLMVGSE